jgi:UDPglucose--hexose-1-phosphate uridylyltransferase
MDKHQLKSELRQDSISGDWILISTVRNKRPNELISRKAPREITPIEKCPFEDLKASGNKPAIILRTFLNSQEWFLQILENKFPALEPLDVDISPKAVGPYNVVGGHGHHDILVLKEHSKPLSDYSKEELGLVFNALKERYKQLLNDPKVRFISIFHNWGTTAGASLFHPHLQILGIPVIPLNVQRFLIGSLNYFKKNEKCGHCATIEFEMQENKRIIFQNDNFVAFTPFVSQEPFQILIYPKIHLASFADLPDDLDNDLGEALGTCLKILKNKLNDPDLNFYLRTTPTQNLEESNSYHWRIEIIPRIDISAGFELNTGIDITSIDPDEGAQFLKE